MRSTDKHIYLFSPSGCINESAFFGYLNHELNTSEMHAIEGHLMECLFCSDAMEGYEKQADKAIAQRNLLAIKNEFALKYNNQQEFKKKDNKRYLVLSMSIAASFILIISGIYLFRTLPTNSKQQELAVNSSAQKNNIPEIKNLNGTNSDNLEEEKTGKDKLDEDVVSKSEYKEKSGMKIQDDRGNGYYKGGDNLNESDGDITETRKATGTKAGNTISANDETVKSIEQIGENRIMMVKDAEARGQTALGTPEMIQKEELKKESVSVETKSIVDQVLPSDNFSVDEKVVSGKKNKGIERKENQEQPSAVTGGVMRTILTPSLNSAMASYNSGNYTVALTQFEYLVEQDKSNYTAIFYLAMCHYNKGEKDSALIQLDKLLKNKKNPFYELGLWQKAQILEELNEKKQAANIYREIIKNNGSMKNNASQKVDELEK